MRAILRQIGAILTRIAELERSRPRAAQVTSTAPLEVRFFGDTSDSPVATAAHYTPTTGDKVLVMRVGSGWWIVADIS